MPFLSRRGEERRRAETAGKMLANAHFGHDRGVEEQKNQLFLPDVHVEPEETERTYNTLAEIPG